MATRYQPELTNSVADRQIEQHVGRAVLPVALILRSDADDARLEAADPIAGPAVVCHLALGPRDAQMSRPAFARRRGVDRERVDAAFELTGKCFVDQAVALKPALPAERLRHNIHPEMSLPAFAMSGMPGVLVGFVHHVEARGSESLGQLLRDEIAPCHGVRIAGARPAGQCRFHCLAWSYSLVTEDDEHAPHARGGDFMSAFRGLRS